MKKESIKSNQTEFNAPEVVAVFEKKNIDEHAYCSWLHALFAIFISKLIHDGIETEEENYYLEQVYMSSMFFQSNIVSIISQHDYHNFSIFRHDVRSIYCLIISFW